jgi:hypothetical protein
MAIRGEGQFPRRVHCSACGIDFAISDTGEAIVLELGTATNTAFTLNGAKAPLATGEICTDQEIDHFATPESADDALARLERQWQAEIVRHTVGWIIPTRRKGLILGIGLGVTFLVMMVTEFVWYGSYDNPVLIVGAVLSLGGGAWLYRRGARHDKAEADWKLAKSDIHLKYVLPNVETVDSRWPLWIRSVPGILLASVCLSGLHLLFFGSGIYWVGSRDLEVSFHVSDSETGRPIAGALIDIPRGREAFCADCAPPIQLRTDENGVARRLCKNCMCSGFEGGKPFFRRHSTFGSHLPDWEFQVSAPGHQESDWHHVSEQEFRRTTLRGDEFATMRVEIKLRPIAEKKRE